MTVIILRLRQQLSFHCLTIYCCVTRSLVLKTAAVVLTMFVPILWAVAFNLLPEGKANLPFFFFCLVCSLPARVRRLYFSIRRWETIVSGAFMITGPFSWQKARSQAEKKLCTVELVFQFSVCLVPILNWSTFRSGS